MSHVAVPPFLARTTRLGASLPYVKVCGLTREADVDVVVTSGASAIGFVFWTRSPRAIDAPTAARLRMRIPPGVLAVGVFVDAVGRGHRRGRAARTTGCRPVARR